MSQTVHLQELHFQEMDMVFLWMWLVNRMLPSSVTVRCEGEVLKLPIKRLSRVSMYVWLIMWLSSHVWKVGPSPEGSKCSPEWQNCPMPFTSDLIMFSWVACLDVIDAQWHNRLYECMQQATPRMPVSLGT